MVTVEVLVRLTPMVCVMVDVVVATTVVVCGCTGYAEEQKACAGVYIASAEAALPYG